jgi:acyl carrier protein
VKFSQRNIPFALATFLNMGSNTRENPFPLALGPGTKVSIGGVVVRELGSISMNPQSVRELIADHLAVGIDSVRDDASFAADLGADSLDMIELAMHFEQALDISIDDTESESCETVRDALDLLERKTITSKAA